MRVRVRREDPTSGQPPFLQTFEVDPGGRRTVGELLDLLRAADPGLGVRSLCRMGLCGGCGMVMNGRLGLACRTALGDVVDETGLLLEPVADVPLERDLAVDMGVFRARHAALLAPRPVFRRSRESIEVDITYACNLRCSHCNRFCSQAPSDVRMDVADIERFVAASRAAGAPWRRVRLLGGEPTLHPELGAILEVLFAYRRSARPELRIQLVTNGHGPAVAAALARLPAGVEVENTRKLSELQPLHDHVTVAPNDVLAPGEADFADGCPVTSMCGIGLTPHGYYPCAVAGAIDRVLGLGRGRATLPAADDDMREDLAEICRYCGHFLVGGSKAFPDEITPTWRAALARWASAPPRLPRR